MSSLGSYYYFTAILFLIDAICDMVFYFTFSKCPIDNSAASLFMFLVILNFFLFFFLIQLGFLVNLFDQMDPDEMLDLGWFKKLLGILVKVYPSLVKILHLVKMLIVLVCGYFAFLNNKTGSSYLDDINFNATLSGITDKNCLNRTSDYLNKTITSYPKQVVIFEVIEIASIFIATCVLGVIKNLIDIEGYFFEPEDPRNGGCRKLFFRRFGP